jgi:pimeloyl-ACP methyl ester carboxylesterase
MDGYRHSVTSADGTRVGLLTAGEGPPLLLVHGGMGCIESWHDITGGLAAVLPQSTLAVLDGQGHEAIETAPGLLVSQLAGFFRY